MIDPLWYDLVLFGTVYLFVQVSTVSMQIITVGTHWYVISFGTGWYGLFIGSE